MKPLIKAGVIALIIYLFFQWEESKRGSTTHGVGGSGGAGGGSGAGAKSGCCGGCGGVGGSVGGAKITQQAVSTTDTGDNGFFASPYFDEPAPIAPVSLPSIPAGPAPTPRVVYSVGTRAGG